MNAQPNSSSDHKSHGPTATWATLQQRAAILRRLREFFHGRKFVEVETPLLSEDTVVDRHLEPWPVASPSGGASRSWLQTSPEFGMKRLLCAGADRIYQVTRAFRVGERGRLHNPEFTIVEWYRRGDDMAAGMRFLGELATELLNAAPAVEMSYEAAFEKFVGINPHRAAVDELQACARDHGIVSAGSDKDDWLNLLLTELVEPQLGQDQPLILYDYPATQAALARIRDEDPPVAERFELYFRGIELANGYHELCDPAALRHRNEHTNVLRTKDGKEPLPVESRMLEAMENPGLPACSGVALGFDRLVMLALEANSLDEVMPFPIERA